MRRGELRLTCNAARCYTECVVGRTIGRIVLNLVTLNFLLLVCAALAALVTRYIALPLVLLLCTIFACYAFLKQVYSILWTCLLVVSSAFFITFLSIEYYELRSGPVVSDVPVSRAPEFQQAKGFHFRDGRVRADLKGSYHYMSSYRNSSADVMHYAAPVVDDQWDTDQPVKVWAVCTVGCEEEWRLPLRAGTVPFSFNMKEHRLAAQDAVSRHMLQSDPHAVFIEWVKSPEAVIERAAKKFWYFILALNVLWVVSYIAWLIARLASHRGDPQPSSVV